jgi:hypothetical protein
MLIAAKPALHRSRGTAATQYPLGDDLRSQVFGAVRATGMQRAWDRYVAGAVLT